MFDKWTPVEWPKAIATSFMTARLGESRGCAPNQFTDQLKPTAPVARILIVEDDFMVASDAEVALTGAGFDVVGIAGSAEDALELARLQNPALALMDIRLLGQRDGIDAAADLLRHLGIRCIFASAHYDRLTLDRAKAVRPLGWLEKPYSMIALVAAARRALRDIG